MSSSEIGEAVRLATAEQMRIYMKYPKEIQVTFTLDQAGALAYVPIPNRDGMDACWSEEDFNLGIDKIRQALRDAGIRMAGDPVE